MPEGDKFTSRCSLISSAKRRNSQSNNNRNLNKLDNRQNSMEPEFDSTGSDETSYSTPITYYPDTPPRSVTPQATRSSMSVRRYSTHEPNRVAPRSSPGGDRNNNPCARAISIRERNLARRASMYVGKPNIHSAPRTNSVSASSANSKSVESVDERCFDDEHYRIVLLGTQGVGKTSLACQFATMDVGVRIYNDVRGLRDRQAQLAVLDDSAEEFEYNHMLHESEVDCYVVIYSTTDNDSFDKARQTLAQIADQRGEHRTQAIILVGNKVDLVRGRAVSTEDGRDLAMEYDTKFIETSLWINFNVDKLLDGIVAQIRLRLQRRKKSSSASSTTSLNNNVNMAQLQTGSTLNLSSSAEGKQRYKQKRYGKSKTWNFMKDILRRVSKSKSCDNLHVL